MGSVRTVRWRGLHSGTRETCRVSIGDDLRVEGEVTGSFGVCFYDLRADPGWGFRSLTLRLDDQRLEVSFDGSVWTVDGAPRPDLDGALEPDLSVSPITNTLPIRRLGLADGGSADIVTAYVSVPELTVVPDPQRYTRLDPDRYLYESRDSDFRREITVDDAGLVVDYPGLFERDVDFPDGSLSDPPR